MTMRVFNQFERFFFWFGTMRPAYLRKSLDGLCTAFLPKKSYRFQSFGMPIEANKQERYIYLRLFAE